MTPNAFFQRFLYRFLSLPGLRRWRPAPDQTASLALLAVGAAIGAILFLLLGVVVFQIGSSLTEGLPQEVQMGSSSVEDLPPDTLRPRVVLFPAAVLGVLSGLVVALVSVGSWNQRAARQRLAGTQEPPARLPILGRWILGPLYLVLVAIITPTVALVTFENIRGSLAWRAAKVEAVARGEKLDISDVVPAPVPDAENFASLPPFRDPGLYRMDGGDTTESQKRLQDHFRPIHLPDRGLPGGRPRGVSPSLADWSQAYLAARDQQNQGKGGSDPLPTLPELPTNAAPAQVILAALAPATPLLEEVCAASHRPYARFPVDWSQGFSALLPHLATFRTIQRALEVRAESYLAQTRPEAAFADLQCALRVAALLRDEPHFVISQLVRNSADRSTHRITAAGIRRHGWTEPQLAELQTIFSEVRVLPRLVLAFEGERNFGLWTMEGWVQGRGNPQEAGSPSIPPFLSGWTRLNQVNHLRYYEILLTELQSLVQHSYEVPPQFALKSFRQKVQLARNRLFSGFPPYHALAKALAGSLEQMPARFAEAETRSQLTALACALERYRLRHGAYPETADALAPDFWPERPRDPFTHGPLGYRREDDGSFSLWSAGIDGADQGGVRSTDRDDAGDDWIWP